MTRSILVIDDESPLCDMLKDIIESEGEGRYHVDYATNSTDAVRLAHKNKYDLMFVDIKLSETASGIDIIKECRDLKDKPKIIIYSAVSKASQYPILVKEGVSHMVTDYLEKNNDLSIDGFLDYIENVLKK